MDLTKLFEKDMTVETSVQVGSERRVTAIEIPVRACVMLRKKRMVGGMPEPDGGES